MNSNFIKSEDLHFTKKFALLVIKIFCIKIDDLRNTKHLHAEGEEFRSISVKIIESIFQTSINNFANNLKTMFENSFSNEMKVSGPFKSQFNLRTYEKVHFVLFMIISRININDIMPSESVSLDPVDELK